MLRTAPAAAQPSNAPASRRKRPPGDQEAAAAALEAEAAGITLETDVATDGDEAETPESEPV